MSPNKCYLTFYFTAVLGKLSCSGTYLLEPTSILLRYLWKARLYRRNSFARTS